MRFISFLFLLLVFSPVALSQNRLEKTLKRFNNESVPYTYVKELAENDKVLLLDAREREEFEVSHLKDAIWVGHKTFDIDSLLRIIPDRNSEIVVYCSIGVRSEKIGDKLLKAGYSDVKNLYGGIFEWKNNGYPVFDSHRQETQKIHAFSKYWAKLLTKGEKVYGKEEVLEN